MKHQITTTITIKQLSFFATIYIHVLLSADVFNVGLLYKIINRQVEGSNIV